MKKNISSEEMLTILIPVRNDYDSVEILIGLIDQTFDEASISKPDILLVDDGSNRASNSQKARILNGNEKNRKAEIEIIEINSRRGHQFAIKSGLSYLRQNNHSAGRHVLVMDGDGEDLPEHALEMHLQGISTDSSIITARRGSRQAGLKFSFFYKIFQLLFRLLTGFEINTGNFMWINANQINHLLEFPSFENHIAASVVRYGSDIKTVTFNRGTRIKGKSQMNFPGLVLHAYGALSVFADIAIARMFILIVTVASGIFAGVVLFIILVLSNAISPISGWASIVVIQATTFIASILIQAILSLLLLLKRSK